MIERPGQLREVRETAGLSIPDVAQRLRLSPRHIEALEAGDWALLPGAAFARASLRSYARLLGVSVQALLDQMPQALDPELLRPATRLDARMPQGQALFGVGGLRRKRLVLGAWFAAVLILGAVAVILLRPPALESLREAVRARQGGSLPPSSPASARPAEAVPSTSTAPETVSTAGGAVSTATAPSDAATERPASSSAVSASLASASPASVVPGSGVAASAPAGPAPAAQSASQTQEAGTLLISTQQDSWVEIRDARDRVVHMSIVRPADPMRLVLSGPVTYTVGNARETRLEWSGRAIDLSGQIKPGTSIAKGSLP
jgi:cytoskeleton protein RodZ